MYTNHTNCSNATVLLCTIECSNQVLYYSTTHTCTQYTVHNEQKNVKLIFNTLLKRRAILHTNPEIHKCFGTNFYPIIYYKCSKTAEIGYRDLMSLVLSIIKRFNLSLFIIFFHSNIFTFYFPQLRSKSV